MNTGRMEGWSRRKETWRKRTNSRFSSEYMDDELGLIYYNYRHLNPRDGRWISRDPH